MLREAAALPRLSDMSSGIVGGPAAALVLAQSERLASTGTVELGCSAVVVAVRPIRAEQGSLYTPCSRANGELLAGKMSVDGPVLAARLAVDDGVAIQRVTGGRSSTERTAGLR